MARHFGQITPHDSSPVNAYISQSRKKTHRDQKNKRTDKPI